MTRPSWNHLALGLLLFSPTAVASIKSSPRLRRPSESDPVAADTANHEAQNVDNLGIAARDLKEDGSVDGLIESGDCALPSRVSNQAADARTDTECGSTAEGGGGCGGGCCRVYHYLICDTSNRLRHLPCVCQANTRTPGLFDGSTVTRGGVTQAWSNTGDAPEGLAVGGTVVQSAMEQPAFSSQAGGSSGKGKGKGKGKGVGEDASDEDDGTGTSFVSSSFGAPTSTQPPGKPGKPYVTLNGVVIYATDVSPTPGNSPTPAVESVILPASAPPMEVPRPVPLAPVPVPARPTEPALPPAWVETPETPVPVPETPSPVPITDAPVPVTPLPVPVTAAPGPSNPMVLVSIDTAVPVAVVPATANVTAVPATVVPVPVTTVPATAVPAPVTAAPVPILPVTAAPVPKQPTVPFPPAWAPVPFPTTAAPQAAVTAAPVPTVPLPTTPMILSAVDATTATTGPVAEGASSSGPASSTTTPGGGGGPNSQACDEGSRYWDEVQFSTFVTCRSTSDDCNEAAGECWLVNFCLCGKPSDGDFVGQCVPSYDLTLLRQAFAAPADP